MDVCIASERAALYDGEDVAGELEIRADALCIIGISLCRNHALQEPRSLGWSRCVNSCRIY